MLTSKQRAFLKKQANSTEAIFQIGKGGISDSVCEEVDKALEARELIKLSVLDNSGVTASEALKILSENCNAEPVMSIGRKLVLYRKSKDAAKIKLPK